MRTKIMLPVYILIAGLIIISCKREKDVQIMKSPPVSDAGLGFSIMLPTDSVELRGSGSDADGNIVSYSWSVIEIWSPANGPTAYEILYPHAPVTKVKNLLEGIYWFELLIEDNDGLTSKSKTSVNVVALNCPCFPNPCDSIGDPCDPWDY
jgi:hypothetical protein